jgi:aspartyl-tRNA(Asn)/glutamyl-tRNA(Gln) amidotransferase subunit C
MPLTLEEVEHIARLARLKLTEEEKRKFQEQLSQILDYAARLQGVETEGIPPTASVLPPRSVLRADEARQGLSRDELLKNAPQVEDDQFQVPAIFD